MSYIKNLQKKNKSKPPLIIEDHVKFPLISSNETWCWYTSTLSDICHFCRSTVEQVLEMRQHLVFQIWKNHSLEMPETWRKSLSHFSSDAAKAVAAKFMLFYLLVRKCNLFPLKKQHPIRVSSDNFEIHIWNCKSYQWPRLDIMRISKASHLQNNNNNN